MQNTNQPSQVQTEDRTWSDLEIRVRALEVSVKYSATQAPVSPGDVVRYAETFYDFLKVDQSANPKK